MDTKPTDPALDPDFFDGAKPRTSISIPAPLGWVLAFGDTDWMYWALTLLPDVVEARVRLNPRGPRITIDGIAVLADPGESINASLLRDLPLGRLETVLNQRRLANHIRYLRVNPGVNTGHNYAPDIPNIAYDPFEHTPATLTSPYVIPGVEAKRRPDTFYEAVADAWTSATLNQEPSPAQAIADANGVALTAVHRWIREARKRAVMAPSSRVSATRG